MRPSPAASPATPDLVLYDGVCGLCHRLVRWLLRLDRRGRLRFAPLQGPTAAPILARHPELAAIDSVVFVHRAGSTDETTAVRSASVLGALRALGGIWGVIAALLRVIPRPVLDALYDAVARRRYRWFGRFETCRLPTAAETHRLLP